MNELNIGQDLVRVPVETLAAVQRVLSAELSGEDAANHLRQIGVETGGALHDLLAERSGRAEGAAGVEEIASDAFWRGLHDFFRDLGWGGVRHERLHPGVIALSSGDWFESGSADASHPSCHFTVGALGEIFRRLSSYDVAVLEVRCRAAGASECRFLVGSPDALEAVFDRMAGGSHYREAVAALG